MTFRTGQKMVCIDDGPLSDGRPHPFKRGTVLTIERVGNCSPDCAGFQFVGAELLDGRWLCCSKRWRPAVDRPTSIEVFKSALKPAREDA